MYFPKELEHTKLQSLLKELEQRALPLIRDCAPLREIVAAMARYQHSRLLYVVDDSDRLLGTISQGLLNRHIFSSSHEPQIHARFLLGSLHAECAADIMQNETLTATSDEMIGKLLKRMLAANIKEIPVIDSKDRVIADITMLDILKFLYKITPENPKKEDQ